MASWLTGSHWSPPDGLLPWHLLSFGQSLPSTTQGHTPLENATKESEYIFFYSPFGYWQSCYRRRYIRASVFSLHLSSSQKKKKKKNQPPTTHASRVERENFVDCKSRDRNRGPFLDAFGFPSLSLSLSMRQRNCFWQREENFRLLLYVWSFKFKSSEIIRKKPKVECDN